MTAPSPQPDARPRDRRGGVVHLVDLDNPPDGLFDLVVGDGDTVLRRRLGSWPQRVRATAELASRRPRTVVAWGERAVEPAGVVPDARALLRLPGHVTRPPRTRQGDEAIFLAHGPRQAEALRAGGARAEVVPPPVVPARAAPDREAMGVGDDDFLWLLPAGESRGAALREALWTVVLLHVMERGRQIHRALLPGDAEPQRAAVRFVANLGVPELLVWLPATPYEAAARAADAGVLVPRGPTGPWPAAVMAANGLPVVTNRLGADAKPLAGRAGVWVAETNRPRVILKRMLELVESGAAKVAGAVPAGFSADEIRATWDAVARPLA